MLDEARALWLRMAPPTPQRLSDFSPAWALFDDPHSGSGVLAGFDLRLTTAMSLGGIDTVCSADGTVEMLSSRLADALGSMPVGTTVRFWAAEILTYRSALGEYVQQFPIETFPGYLARRRAELCARRAAPRRRHLLLTVSTTPHFATLPYAASALGMIERTVTRRAHELVTHKLRELRGLMDRFRGGLEGTGIAARLLPKQAFYEALWQLANPMRAAWQPEAPRLRDGVSLRTQLFCSGLYNGVDYFVREDHHHRVLSLKLLPENVWPECIEAVQGFAFPHVLNVSVRRADTEKTIKRLSERASGSFEQRKAMAKYRGHEKNEQLADKRLLGEQHDACALLEALEQGDAPCEVALQLLLSAPDEESLSSYTEQALAAFRSQAFGRAEASIEEHRAREAYLGMLPGHDALVGDRYHTVLASRAADLLPVFATAVGARMPSYYFTTRERTLYGFDPFEAGRRAHNLMVIGATGGGKSATVRALLQGQLGRGGRAVIITRGRDYHRFAELLGGQSHDLSLEDTELALGPFTTAVELQPSTSKGRAQLAHLANVITVMATEPEQRLSRSTRSAIFRALRRLYKQHPQDSAPTLADYLQVLRTMRTEEPEMGSELDTLVANLRLWVEGPHGPAFCNNRRSIEATLSVWNLEPLEDADTQGVVLALLSGVVARSVSCGPTIVVLDECWAILQSDAGANLVQTLYRTIRKLGSAVWGVSQTIYDFLSLKDEARGSLVNNSPIRFYHKADNDNEVTKTAEVFRFSPRATDALRHLQAHKGKYAELLIEDAGQMRVVQLVPTGTELWMMTSDPLDLALEQRARAKYPKAPLRRIVKSLGKQFPHGAAHGRSNTAA